MKPCPVCGSRSTHSSVHRSALPVFQNVVWETCQAAKDAPSAPFELSTCKDCGFSFNGMFSSEAVTYDERYNNAVPSDAFKQYYQSLISMLAKRFAIADGTVYDVGCGKGEFLQMFCAAVPGIYGIGIDPSCEPVERANFRLIRDVLKPSHFAPDTKLVVVRHVLEHIEKPVEFVEMLRTCVPDVPVFVEVPDFDWIIRNRAFWDFCYEHCNYFTLESLAVALRAAGFRPIDQQTSFDGQYQWAICRPCDPARPPAGSGASAVADVARYDAVEKAEIDRVRKLADTNGGLALWGMSTKGVILSVLLGDDRVLGGVDINPEKQGRFAGTSGVRINPPEWVLELPEGTPLLVMNPNYFDEISATVRELGAPVKLLKA